MDDVQDTIFIPRVSRDVVELSGVAASLVLG
jgi:hypothetical protein